MCGKGFANLLFPLVAAGVLANEPVHPGAATTLQATCPKCRARVFSSFDWCPQCGAALRSRACAYCGNQMDGSAGFCPSCGAPAGGKGMS